MATRFYLSNTTASITPFADPGWEQTGEVSVRKLVYTKAVQVAEATANRQITVPITTTQDILCLQMVSNPIPSQLISGTMSAVIRCSESSVDANALMACSIRVMSVDGQTSRGTLFASQNIDVEFTLTGAPETRAFIATLTPVQAQASDRLVVEFGMSVTAPVTAQSALMRIGFDPTQADFTLADGQTSSTLNPWLEFSQNLYGTPFNNFSTPSSGNGMWFSGGAV
jgi:hypothetical protein